ASYSNSWAYFRTLNLVTVLQRDLGLRYHKAEVPEAAEFETADQFIFGAIQGNGGTCATIPIVVIAVGRRLGYPLKLVSTKGHFFARWDDPSGERFNIEATN